MLQELDTFLHGLGAAVAGEMKSFKQVGVMPPVGQAVHSNTPVWVSCVVAVFEVVLSI